MFTVETGPKTGYICVLPLDTAKTASETSGSAWAGQAPIWPLFPVREGPIYVPGWGTPSNGPPRIWARIGRLLCTNAYEASGGLKFQRGNFRGFPEPGT